MDYTLFLPRRLSQAGCVIAGTKLAAHYAALQPDLEDPKPPLAPKVASSILAVDNHTRSIAALPTSDAVMIEIDRGADRCIAALDDQLEGIQRSFDHASILPLTDEEQARLADATLVRGALLPAGTGFLRLVYSQQWARMSAMITALDRVEVTAAIARLGLGSEIARLRRWVEIYGVKLGVTERKQADPAAAAIEAWHQAYGELIAHLHSEYNDRRDELQAKIREALLAPYHEQADEERRAEQKAKAKRKLVGGQ